MQYGRNVPGAAFSLPCRKAKNSPEFGAGNIGVMLRRAQNTSEGLRRVQEDAAEGGSFPARKGCASKKACQKNTAPAGTAGAV